MLDNDALHYTGITCGRADEVLSALVWAMQEGGGPTRKLTLVFDTLSRFVTGFSKYWRVPKWFLKDTYRQRDLWEEPEWLAKSLEEMKAAYPRVAATRAFARLVQAQLRVLSDRQEEPIEVASAWHTLEVRALVSYGSREEHCHSSRDDTNG